jgi:hypothetical protein
MEYKKSENMAHACVRSDRALRQLKKALQESSQGEHRATEELLGEMESFETVLKATWTGLRIAGWDYEILNNPAPGIPEARDLLGCLRICHLFNIELLEFYRNFPKDFEIAQQSITGISRFETALISAALECLKSPEYSGTLPEWLKKSKDKY